MKLVPGRCSLFIDDTRNLLRNREQQVHIFRSNQFYKSRLHVGERRLEETRLDRTRTSDTRTNQTLLGPD